MILEQYYVYSAYMPLAFEQFFSNYLREIRDQHSSSSSSNLNFYHKRFIFISLVVSCFQINNKKWSKSKKLVHKVHLLQNDQFGREYKRNYFYWSISPPASSRMHGPQCDPMRCPNAICWTVLARRDEA